MAQYDKLHVKTRFLIKQKQKKKRKRHLLTREDDTQKPPK